MMDLYKLSLSAGQCKEKQTMISEMNAKRPMHSKLHRTLKKTLFILLLHMWKCRYCIPPDLKSLDLQVLDWLEAGCRRRYARITVDQIGRRQCIDLRRETDEPEAGYRRVVSWPLQNLLFDKPAQTVVGSAVRRGLQLQEQRHALAEHAASRVSGCHLQLWLAGCGLAGCGLAGCGLAGCGLMWLSGCRFTLFGALGNIHKVRH
jgi:hypothetical protein